MARSELWECPKCGERFTTRNQWHACGRYSLDALFVRSAPFVRELFDQFADMVRRCGPVTVIPQKTRIAFQVRMRFAAIHPRRSHLLGHLILAERHDDGPWLKVETYSPRSHRHVFRIAEPEDLAGGFERWVREAYKVGRQDHLGTGRATGR